MIQMQFVNNKLTQSQIDEIKGNYNIKYGTIKTEIENKMNLMLKCFLNDILNLYDNIEQITTEKEIMKELDRKINENKILQNKIIEKDKIENNLRYEIEKLNKQISRLKEQILTRTSSNASNNKYRSCKNKDNSRKTLMICSSSPTYLKITPFNFWSNKPNIKPKTSYLKKYKEILEKRVFTDNNIKKVKNNLNLLGYNRKNSVFSFKDSPIFNINNNIANDNNQNKENLNLFNNQTSDNEISKKKQKEKSQEVMKYINNTKITNHKSNSSNKTNLELEKLMKEFDIAIDDELEMLEEEENNIKKLIQE